MSLIVDTHTMAEESGSKEPSIFGGSEPPEADPLITTAAEHAASEHPFWGARERRANAGQSRGSRNHHRHVGNVEQNETSEAEAMPQFAPISVKELEFAYFQDGAESSVDSSSESEQEEDGRAPKKKKRKKAATTEVSSENRLASAAFGGSAEAEGSDSSDEDEVCEEAGSEQAKAFQKEILDLKTQLKRQSERYTFVCCSGAPLSMYHSISTFHITNAPTVNHDSTKECLLLTLNTHLAVRTCHEIM